MSQQLETLIYTSASDTKRASTIWKSTCAKGGSFHFKIVDRTCFLAMTTSKIAVYSLSGTQAYPHKCISFQIPPLTNPFLLTDLKNTTDDALPNYLTSLKFSQSHFLTDVRLGLGYTAVVIAAVTFYADYKLGWDATKEATLWAVTAYFIINGALTVWIWGVERGKVFVGEKGRTLVRTFCDDEKNRGAAVGLLYGLIWTRSPLHRIPRNTTRHIV